MEAGQFSSSQARVSWRNCSRSFTGLPRGFISVIAGQPAARRIANQAGHNRPSQPAVPVQKSDLNIQYVLRTFKYLPVFGGIKSSSHISWEGGINHFYLGGHCARALPPSIGTPLTAVVNPDHSGLLSYRLNYPLPGSFGHLRIRRGSA